MAALATTVKDVLSRFFSSRSLMTEQQRKERYIAQQIANCERYCKKLKSELDKDKEINLSFYEGAGGGIREGVAKRIVYRLEDEQKFDQKILFEKYNAVRGALEILRLESENPINKYRQHLFNNRHLLGKRRDDTFITIAKGAGLAASTVCSLGLGSYFAYHSFFGKRATQGKKLYLGSETSLVFKKN